MTHHDICVTEEILNLLTAQELQNIVHQFYMNDNQVKQSVHCTVALLNTHTDRILIMIEYRYLMYQCINNVPQDEISRYIVVLIFWYTPTNCPVKEKYPVLSKALELF